MRVECIKLEVTCVCVCAWGEAAAGGGMRMIFEYPASYHVWQYAYAHVPFSPSLSFDRCRVIYVSLHMA